METPIETALKTLKTSGADLYCQQQAWELIKCTLVALMSLDDDKIKLTQLFTHTRYWLVLCIAPHYCDSQGCKVSMLAYTCPHKPLINFKVAICSHEADCPFTCGLVYDLMCK